MMVSNRLLDLPGDDTLNGLDDLLKAEIPERRRRVRSQRRRLPLMQRPRRREAAVAKRLEILNPLSPALGILKHAVDEDDGLAHG
jgi:hypothetical protein